MAVAFAGAFVAVLKAAAISFALSAVTKALGPKPKKDGSRQPWGGNVAVNYTSTEQRIQYVYGEVRVGGLETTPAFNAPLSPNVLFRCVTIGFGRIEGITDHYINDVLLPSSSMVVVTSPGHSLAYLGSAGVGANVYNNYGNGLYQAVIYTGTTSHVSYSGLSVAIGVAFLGYNLAHVEHNYSLNANRTNYRGFPTQTYVVKGLWLYDPRLDTTQSGGSGSHRLATPSTWAYSNNPALALAHHLTHWAAGDYESDEINWQSVMTAADACDVVVYTPTGTAKRYTVAGVLLAPTTPEEFIENISKLAETMLGRIIYTAGVWNVYAGVWTTPTVSIDSSDWLNVPSIEIEGGYKKRFNSVQAWYNSSSKNYMRSSLVRENSTYLTADSNARVSRQLELPMCISDFEAQRKSETLLRQSRNQIVISGILPPRFSNAGMYDTATIINSAYSWYSKTFRLIASTDNDDGSRSVAFQEEQSTDWTDIGTADYTAVSTTALPAVNDWNPSAPTNFSITPNVNGTLMFNFGRPTVRPANTLMRVIRSTNSADASVGTVVWEGDALSVALVMPTSAHWYYGQAVCNSLVSPYYPNTFGIVGRPNAEAQPRFGYSAISDPDIVYSAENSVFWYTAFPQVFSLSLTGGVSGGKIIITVNSATTKTHTYYSMYSLQNGLNERFYAAPYMASITARAASVETLGGFLEGDALGITPVAWNGSGTIDPWLWNPGAADPGGKNSVVILGNAALFSTVTSMLCNSVGLWRTITGVGSMVTEFSTPNTLSVNPTSYPYLISRLVVGTDTFKGVLEIDLVRLQYGY